jgi:hypothetical protein
MNRCLAFSASQRHGAPGFSLGGFFFCLLHEPILILQRSTCLLFPKGETIVCGRVTHLPHPPLASSRK